MRIYLYATFLEDANRLCQEIDSRFLHSFGSFGNSELNSSFVHKALDFFNHRIVWDAATCGGTLNNKHDEPTSFFFIIPIEAAHRRLPRRPSLLGGGVAATETGDQEILARKEDEGGQEQGRGEDVGSGGSAGDQCAACRGRVAAEGGPGIG